MLQQNQNPSPNQSSANTAQTTTSHANTSSERSSDRDYFGNQAYLPRPKTPVLRFTPYSWAKLQFMCHAGFTEIGGFGITVPTDPLLVYDFVTTKQECTSATVKFDDIAVADFFEDQVVAGRRPENFGRIWIHTHPGSSPDPSSQDEHTLRSVFGRCEWSVMSILARGGRTYARLRFNTGPGGDMEIATTVDYQFSFCGSDHEAWREEYLRNVHEHKFQTTYEKNGGVWVPTKNDPGSTAIMAAKDNDTFGADGLTKDDLDAYGFGQGFD